MAVIARFTVDTTCGCCEGDIYIVLGPCESREGTATLCGFSGYDDGTYDSGDPTAWAGQYRKWSTRTIVGTYYDRVSGACDYDFKYVYTGDAVLECSGFTGYALFNSFRKDSPGCVETQTGFDVDVTETNNLSVSVGPAPCTPGMQVASTVVSLTLKTLEGCAVSSWDGTGSETLSEEQHWYDALTGEGVVAGEECCTQTTSADLTTPESQSSISASLRAVRRGFTVAGCPDGTPVTVLITIYRVLADLSIETREDEVEVLCGELTYYQIPQPAPGDPGWCWQSIVLVA